MAHTAKATRENRAITVDFHDEATYFELLSSMRSLSTSRADSCRRGGLKNAFEIPILLQTFAVPSFDSSGAGAASRAWGRSQNVVVASSLSLRACWRRAAGVLPRKPDSVRAVPRRPP
jgi:hypothetical protein